MVFVDFLFVMEALEMKVVVRLFVEGWMLLVIKLVLMLVGEVVL